MVTKTTTISALTIATYTGTWRVISDKTTKLALMAAANHVMMLTTRRWRATRST